MCNNILLVLKVKVAWLCGCGSRTWLVAHPPGRNHFLFTLVTPPPRGLKHRPFLLQYRAAFHFSSLSLFTFSLTILPPQAESHMCTAAQPHTHTHTHTSWTLTNTLIHHLTHIMLCHCRPVLLNHSCKHHRPLLLDLPLSFFPSHVFSLLSICYLFLVPLSISPSSPFSNFLLCSPAFFPGIETWPVVSLA